jgi:probable rRNA maturation factor
LIIARRKLSTSLQRSLQTFAARAQKATALQGEVAILLTDNAEIQQLNRDFRGKNKPTDVLSFPSDGEGIAGDIAISLDIAEQNGDALGHGTLTELQVLVLHGMLHLAGHDHETDNGEMATLEQKLREKLGLEHGLIERTHEKGLAKSSRRPQASKRGLHGPRAKSVSKRKSV